MLNEAAILETLHEQLVRVADTTSYEFEFVFVNDGSQDASWSVLCGLRQGDPRVLALDLTRNFGQHQALTAGIDHARGDAVILMDADFEDDPEALLQLLTAWEEGNDVVYAERGRRQLGFVRGLGTRAFHAINRQLGMPPAGPSR